MLEKVLDNHIYSIIKTIVGFDKVNEIRLRAGLPVVILSQGALYFLGENGLTLTKAHAIIITKEKIENFIYKASEFSIYSVNEELKEGYIVLSDGERIGIAGTVIMENNQVKTITNFTSINIRIPHQIKGVAKKMLNKIMVSNEVLNTLIISPPGQGKTTMLRDLAYLLSEENYFSNLLILDERGEIAGKNNSMDLGCFCDVLSFCTKKIGFLQGIRALNPNIILTDELGKNEDFEAIKFAKNSGVTIIATIHASSINQLQDKLSFPVIKNVFERYVLLKKRGLPGQIDSIYDENFNII